MKTLIICFSQTGNTQTIAESIQAGITRSGHACRIVSIKDASQADIDDCDLIGIGTPTFYYREPLNVTRFIEALEPSAGKPCFLFCTHGSIIGNTFAHMQRGLARKGYTVVDAWDTYADSSLQFYPEVMHTAGHPDDRELAAAERFGESIFEKSRAVLDGRADPPPEPPLDTESWWAKDSQMLTPTYLRQIFPVFEIDLERCTRCGQCEENCPVDAIDVDADPPEIQKEGCIFCLYCEKQCPEGAVLADWTTVAEMIRPNLRKYVGALREARDEGAFRPYVDFEKIV
ncbi:MAG: EFR1 family ferrodoxin [Desulfobacterales bacterium]